MREFEILPVVDITEVSKAALVMESMRSKMAKIPVSISIEQGSAAGRPGIDVCVSQPMHGIYRPNEAVDQVKINLANKVEMETLEKIDAYLEKAVQCIEDYEVAPDYVDALAAIERNPLITHVHWSKQLQLSAQHRQLVMDYYDFVDAQTVARNLYPQWSAAQPIAAINKQSQRGTLLFIETEQGKRYPVQLFDLSARSPTIYPMVKQLMQNTNEQQLTHMELLHWLCSSIEFTVPKTDSKIEQDLAQNQFESALQRISDAGPSQTVLMKPIEVCQQGNQPLFSQMVAQWLSHESIVLSNKERESVIDNLKAQMAALGIEKLSLTG